MTEIKTYIVTVMGALFTLLAPIHHFMYAMGLLFFLDLMFGLTAARVNNEPWEMKKACKFFRNCAIFFVTTAALFIIGYLMNELQQTIVVVKMICFIALYIFGTNIIRNWRFVLTPNSAWYKFVDLLYYVLSVKFMEKMPFVKKWQAEAEKKKNENNNDNGTTGTDEG